MLYGRLPATRSGSSSGCTGSVARSIFRKSPETTVTFGGADASRPAARSPIDFDADQPRAPGTPARTSARRAPVRSRGTSRRVAARSPRRLRTHAGSEKVLSETFSWLQRNVRRNKRRAVREPPLPNVRAVREPPLQTYGRFANRPYKVRRAMTRLSISSISSSLIPK